MNETLITLAIGNAVFTLASLITRATKTEADDKVVGGISKLWNILFEASRKK